MTAGQIEETFAAGGRVYGICFHYVANPGVVNTPNDWFVTAENQCPLSDDQRRHSAMAGSESVVAGA